MKIKFGAIDHGLTFHSDHKLRTVIWEYENESIPSDLYAHLETFNREFTPKSPTWQILQTLLNRHEIKGFQRRIRYMLREGIFPCATGYRDYPYPPV